MNNYIDLDESLPTLDIQFLSPNLVAEIKGGMLALCLDAIFRNEGLMEAREIIRRDGEEGDNVSRWL